MYGEQLPLFECSCLRTGSPIACQVGVSNGDIRANATVVHVRCGSSTTWTGTVQPLS
jgi:hypothetical protein